MRLLPLPPRYTFLPIASLFPFANKSIVIQTEDPDSFQLICIPLIYSYKLLETVQLVELIILMICSVILSKGAKFVLKSYLFPVLLMIVSRIKMLPCLQYCALFATFGRNRVKCHPLLIDQCIFPQFVAIGHRFDFFLLLCSYKL